jgi:peptidoglycan/LPS O-acetylase OafA/YrhL
MMTLERGESLILGAILLTVAGFAGAASFTHVHDWTMRNSPAGTPGWFGWANATISELVPTACALVIRRRRRTAQPVGYPLGLLVAAVALSLAAQLAVAKPGPSGWLLSAVPALAFVALTKLVLSTAPRPAATETGSPAEPLTVEPIEEVTPPMPPAPAAVRANGAIPSGVVR